MFVQFGLSRVGSAVRGEQLMGTLESVLVTPTAPTTVQLGSVAFDLLYIPIRTALFLGLTAVSFGLHFSAGGTLPAALILLAFIPFVWGLGVVAGATILTIRRGGGMVGFGVLALALASGIYFPVDLLPGWVEATADFNPIALAIEGIREALLGNVTASETASILAVLTPPVAGRARAGPAHVPAGASPRAAPRNPGALLMTRGGCRRPASTSVRAARGRALWERVDSLLARTDDLDALRAHRLHLLAARRRRLGLPVPRSSRRSSSARAGSPCSRPSCSPPPVRRTTGAWCS